MTDPPKTPPRPAKGDVDSDKEIFEDAVESTPRAAVKSSEEHELPMKHRSIPKVEPANSDELKEEIRPSSIHSNSSNKLSITSSNDGTPTASSLASNLTQTFKSPFTWLSRLPTNERKQAIANATANDRPPLGDNQLSASSLAALKDRFKLLRMREEAGVDPNGVTSTESLPSVAEHVEEDGGATRRSRAASIINPQLPPGTAAGIAEGPGQEPVNWDLWQDVVTEGPTAVGKKSAEELNDAITSGIPQPIRGVIWQVLADSKNEGLESFYHELVARGTEREKSPNGQTEEEPNASSASSIHSDKFGPTSPSPSVDGFTNPLAPKPRSPREEVAHIQVLEKTIKRDLGARTAYSKFLMSSGLQDGLFGICKAYALYDEEVGYAQGMNFIAMPFLFNMREEEAFCLFVKLMSKYGMREMFTNDMPGLHLHLYQFERILEDREPALFCHLNRRGVTPGLYATQWFLTLFAYRFPLQLVQRIYDLILSSSLPTSILKFAIVLMQKNRDALLSMTDMVQLSSFLKENIFDVYIDKSPSSSSLLESGFFGSATGGADKAVYHADALVKDACAVEIDQVVLDGYTAEWEERTRAEKEREAELDGLRNQVTSLTKKVRVLEERVQKSDSEHVGLASELVRTKVENENYSEENESLKGRVEELMRVVDSQTEEVEKRLQGEMDEVMKRNAQVHESNRLLEDEKVDLERILVETRVKYAQINEEHDTLKQRWQNIVSMMNTK